MAIKTSHNITIEIDDEKFNIIRRDFTKQEAKEFEKSAKKRADKFKELDEKKDILAQLESEFEINKCILEDGNKDDKGKIVFEQKGLNKKIPALKKEIEALGSNNEGLYNELESMTKETLEKVISGADKIKLFEAVEQKGISYIALSEEIAKMVQELVKKK